MRGGVSSQKSFNPRDLKRFGLEYKKSRITVLSDRDLRREALEFLENVYDEFERYCRREPFFLTSYYPLKVDETAPRIAILMADAGERAGVGPMAAVAGAFSEEVGKYLLHKGAKEVIVENGGDIFMEVRDERVVGVYAGSSEFSDRIGFRVVPEETPLAICTSSSSVGHSISLGDSDAVSVVAKSCPLADAAATAIGNEVKGSSGMEKGLRRASEIIGVEGALLIRGNEMGTFGKLPEIVRT
jgi:ApbE superfamily uncharacterized protein (UPF0280 family)